MSRRRWERTARPRREWRTTHLIVRVRTAHSVAVAAAPAAAKHKGRDEGAGPRALVTNDAGHSPKVGVGWHMSMCVHVNMCRGTDVDVGGAGSTVRIHMAIHFQS